MGDAVSLRSRGPGRALAAGLTAGVAVGLACGLVAAVLLATAPGVMRPVGGSIAAAAFYLSLLVVAGGAGGLILGAALLRAARPWPAALGAAVVAALAAPVLVIANVRHLPELLSVPSIAANVAILALALAGAVTLGGLFERLRARRPPRPWPAAAVLGGAAAVAAWTPSVQPERETAPASSWAGPAARPVAAAAKPETLSTLLLVTVDTLRADRLGCYGYPRDTSPRLDRLAETGSRFERVIAQAPNTHPSMASMLVGQPLTAFDHLALTDFVPRGADTLAREMRRRGYRTGAVVSNPYLKRELGFDQGFERFDDTTAMVGDAAAVTDRALEVAARLDGPMFLWVHYLDPHHPYRPPAPYDVRFGPPVQRIDRAQTRPDLTEWLIDAGAGRVRLDESEWQRLSDLYDGEIAYVDEHIGRLLDGLREAGRLERARVAVTADHGEEFLDHGGVLHSHTLYRELVRLPLIVWTSLDGRARVVSDPLPATAVGRLLLGDVAVDVDDGVLSEKLHEERGRRPPLVSLRTASHTLITTAYRPYLGWRPRRLARSLEQLMLFAPVAYRRQLFGAEDEAERRDLARSEPAVVRELGARLARGYRAGVVPRTRDRPDGEPAGARPSAETLEQLEALGYVH